MFENRWAKRCLILFTFFFLFFYGLEIDAFARAGGGRSSGSRGSRSSTPPRSYSAPKSSQPYQAPREYSAPSRTVPQPGQQPQYSFWRSFGGGLLGGLVGGMLFRSLGFGAGYGGLGGGIGIFDILLLVAILYGIYWFIKKRRQEAVVGGHYERTTEAVEEAPYKTSFGPPSEQLQETDWDLEKGLSHIRQMDPYFDEKVFKDLCMDNFFKIQGAWANRDMSQARNLLTEEMFRIIQEDAENLKKEKKINKLENIAVRAVDITEAWQESGKDYITVRFYASLLDYTVDEFSGHVVAGSKTQPVKFEEYWTFSRSVGNNPWQLSAINQPE